MKRKQAEKQLRLQHDINWMWDYFGEDKILIGSHHKKRVFRVLIQNEWKMRSLIPNRLITKIDDNGWTFRRNPMERTIFILKSDIEEIFLKRYVVIKNGPAYDLLFDTHIQRKRFFKLKRLYDKGFLTKDLTPKLIKMAGNKNLKDGYDLIKQDYRERNIFLHFRKAGPKCKPIIDFDSHSSISKFF